MKAPEMVFQNGTLVLKTYDYSGGDLRIYPVLSEQINKGEPQGLVSRLAMPDRSVKWYRGTIIGECLEDWYRSPDAVRAPFTEARYVGTDVSKETFTCQNYALKWRITAEDLSSDDRGDQRSDLREQRASSCRDYLLGNKERRFGNVVNSSSNVNTGYVVKSAWNAATNANNPIDDCNLALNRVEDTTGIRPNFASLGVPAQRACLANSAWRSITAGGDPWDRMRALLRVNSLYLAGGVYNANAQLLPANLTPIFNDIFFACVTAPENSLLPCWGVTPLWRPQGTKGRFIVEVHPFDEKTKSEEVEVGIYETELVLEPRLGVTIIGVNSAQAGGI